LHGIFVFNHCGSPAVHHVFLLTNEKQFILFIDSIKLKAVISRQFSRKSGFLKFSYNIPHVIAFRQMNVCTEFKASHTISSMAETKQGNLEVVIFTINSTQRNGPK
jgi:hypothetical protein